VACWVVVCVCFLEPVDCLTKWFIIIIMLHVSVRLKKKRITTSWLKFFTLTFVRFFRMTACCVQAVWCVGLLCVHVCLSTWFIIIIIMLHVSGRLKKKRITTSWLKVFTLTLVRFFRMTACCVQAVWCVGLLCVHVCLSPWIV